MGKGGHSGDVDSVKVPELRMLSWAEVKTHDKHNDKWLVIDGQVYNITNWARKHPGGSKVISHFAGQDATDAFRAFHNDLSYVRKYLKPIHVGALDSSEIKECDMDRDFREIRTKAEEMGLFKPSFVFFALDLGHIIALEAIAYLILAYLGTGWLPLIITTLCYATVQAQVGWIQHDFGHLSVFHISKWDHFFHYLTIGLIKGASPSWWNHMHYQHHAKPNVMGKDPDVRVEALFVVGNTMPVEVAKTQKNNTMPYNWQHRYFYIVAPLLFPVYFQFMLFRHIFSRRLWLDLIIVIAFFAKLFYLYIPLLGVTNTLVFYFVVRCIESHWFTWVAQSNHIPMEIEHDQAEPWLTLQMHATCNVEKSHFNDWFTGHLNFQIEHHLFPTMPRHNLYKITPLVKSLCKKHNVSYQVKSLWQAFADIPKSLKHSGELWQSTYQSLYSS